MYFFIINNKNWVRDTPVTSHTYIYYYDPDTYLSLQCFYIWPRDSLRPCSLCTTVTVQRLWYYVHYYYHLVNDTRTSKAHEIKFVVTHVQINPNNVTSYVVALRRSVNENVLAFSFLFREPFEPAEILTPITSHIGASRQSCLKHVLSYPLVCDSFVDKNKRLVVL